MSPPPPAAREHRFRSLYEDNRPDLLRFVRRRTDPDRADDVVAEAFLVVWRRLDDAPTGPDAVRPWIFGIARNLLLNDRRGEQRRRALEIRLADPTYLGPGDDLADGVVDLVDLARAWRLLSAIHQEALALAVLDGLDAPQAGAVLDISPVAFRLRLSRARRALRSHLDRQPQRDQPARAVERTLP